LAAVFFLYWAASGNRTLRLSVLLLSNYIFLVHFGLSYIILIPAAGMLDFLAGLGIERFKNRLARRALLALSVVVNLGLLWSVRYAGALAANSPIDRAGIWTVAFPLGLSFYAFQALTYTIDIYRGDMKATTSCLEHLTAVSLFPTPLAGPITRAGDLIPQLVRKVSLTSEQTGNALFLICLGLVKKILIADYLAANLVDRAFDLPKLYSGFEVLAGVYGYAFQLYYDFSGYTDIAIGSMLLLGLKLPRNFDRPYAALSIPEFWKKWHISFSSWLRDYLYFSLPGLRSKRKVYTYLNLVLMMLLAGLWHGAGWTFVIWGLLHGLGLAGTRAWQVWRGRRQPSISVWVKLACGFLTFQFVCLTWVFFRAPSVEAALAVLERIASLTFSAGNLSGGLLLVLAIAAVGHYLPDRWRDTPAQWFARAPFYAQAAAMLLVVLALQLLSGRGAAPFVYTRF
jgi:D-alanyl-lipoteichoic acid acyltransferase DltB (MBOAT superfamily)